MPDSTQVINFVHVYRTVLVLSLSLLYSENADVLQHEREGTCLLRMLLPCVSRHTDVCQRALLTPDCGDRAVVICPLARCRVLCRFLDAT